MRRWACLAVALYGLTLSAQEPAVAVTFGWDLDPSHAGAVVFEVSVDGSSGQPCGAVQVLPTERRCSTAIPPGPHSFRMRAIDPVGPVVSVWSLPIEATIPGGQVTPGPFTVTWSRESSTAPPSTVYVSASFTATTGTLLSTYTPEVGGAFALHAGVLTIRGNALDSPTFSMAAGTTATVLPSADYDVLADVTVVMAGQGNSAGVYVRATSNFSQGYRGRFDQADLSWKLERIANSVPTLLGSPSVDAGFLSGTRRLGVRAAGSTITLQVDGVERIRVTDTAVTAANRAGIYGAGGRAGAVLLDNFVVRE